MKNYLLRGSIVFLFTVGFLSVASGVSEAAITFRSASTVVSDTSSPASISKPSGTVNGDVMVALITVVDKNNVGSSVTPPSGWTEIREVYNSSVLRMRTIAYYRVAFNEGSSYSFTYDDNFAGVILTYTGVDTTDPVDVSGGQTNSADTSFTAPSITTTVANTMLVNVSGAYYTLGSPSFTPPSGFTERADWGSTGTDIYMGVSEDTQGSAGSTGSKTATTNQTTSGGAALMFALKPYVPPPPTATTTSATSVTASGATLRSSVNPNGFTTTVSYRYGTSNVACSSLSSTTAGTGIGSGTSNVSPNSRSISGLNPGQIYYFCVQAVNTNGTTYGSVLNFITSTSAPTITSPTDTSITASSATLGGNVTSDGGATITGRGVCYSTSDNTPGLSEGGVICESTTGTTGVFTIGVSSLTQNTLYYYRAYATNSQGTSYTSTDSFTTLASTPSVTTGAASSITQTTATLNSTINPNGNATTAWFRYYTSSQASCADSGGTRAPASSGASMGSGSSGVPDSRSISGLTPGTTYHVCAFASNTHGTGGVGQSSISFSTLVGTPTSVSASGESDLSSYYVTLNGTGIPNNFASHGFFRLFTSNPGSCTDSGGTRYPSASGDDTSLGSGASGAGFSYEVIGSVAPNTSYYYCAFARNQYGTTPSSVDSFTTPAGPVGPCDPPLSGNHTVISSCTYSGDIGGVDAGTGTSNTAILKVNPGRTLTVAPGQTVSWGSMDLRGGGRVALSNGATLRKTPVWMIDADVDGYAASNVLYHGVQPEGGVRRNTLYDNYPYYSILSGAQSGYEADCNDDAYSEENSC